MIAIIDNGGGNIASIQFALERLGYESTLTIDKDAIQKADKVILPGVGAAKAAMEKLKSHNLIDVIKNLKQPVIGFCLGMQILFEHSEEGDVNCLGIVPGVIKKFKPSASLRVPHMGWNTINILRESPLLKDIKQSSYVYFVHSYFAPINEATLISTNYGNDFAAAIQYKNFYGTQFHPERSSETGEQLLKNFLELC